MRRPAFLAAAALLAQAAGASTPAAWVAEERAAMRACVAASGLVHARARPPVHFSDRLAIDVVRVDGRLARGLRKATTVTCVYERRTRRTETAEGA